MPKDELDIAIESLAARTNRNPKELRNVFARILQSAVSTHTGIQELERLGVSGLVRNTLQSLLGEFGIPAAIKKDPKH